ncbi:cytochrome P450 [Actinomadura algeriensis]|uniref:Cytochrome P450 n=1 Tax=Actinomadura algeriensis TaxID=1679523 RepID=A0ABR9JVE5_9ACTN|nr:cytochrome P450 [Actinomadura algeriensis]MBE1534522.1 cytochrome P450 [Actinomadura algeriensis]
MNWERRLYLAAHPVAYPLLRGLARRGPVVRVPGVGVVVNDAAVARGVLMDGETFRKDGPGSPGELWTPVLGPSVLLNMEGEAHRALRRRLTDLFTPAYADELCGRVLAAPLDRLRDRLASGAPVDLVDAARVLAGAVISEVIGLDLAAEGEFRRLFERGERIVAMVSLRTRRLSPAQIRRARAVLDPLGDAAAKSYAAGDETTVMGRMRTLGLSADEARGAAGAFFLTGTETVATFVPRVVALLADSGRLAGAPADGFLDRAIDEAMRVTTPTPVMLRSVHRAAEIGGAPVRPGDRILIATHNCCRALGPFDPDRPHPPELRRLWFGAGPHFCIGYPLAMAQIRRVVRTVLDATPLRIVERSAARGVLIPTYRHLSVRSEARRRGDGAGAGVVTLVRRGRSAESGADTTFEERTP